MFDFNAIQLGMNLMTTGFCVCPLNQSQWGLKKRMEQQTSGPVGGAGRHMSPPCTTIGRITTNKTKNTQKIKLYGSLTTKDLKKPYPSRHVEEGETSSQDGEDVVWQW